MNILLVDDSHFSRYCVAKSLARVGHNVIECENGEDALKRFSECYFPLVLTDIMMPGITGLELLRKISALPAGKDTDVVLFTASNQVELAIEALRAGAYDYLLKPINEQELSIIIQRVIEQRLILKEHRQLKEQFIYEVEAATEETRQELERLKEVLAHTSGTHQVGFFSPIMQNLVLQAQKYHTDRAIPVLIEGETGTGKELFASMIHNGCLLSGEPFVPINCAAISPTLFESELFGYEAGAYTGGLTKGQKGKIDLAQGGTLFLDEIGEMSMELQAKLLRVIQEKEFFRVGGLQRIKTDIRIICATNVDLYERLKSGTFRKDLYYRLKVGHILIPALRQRPEDIVPLAELFLKQFAQDKGKRFVRLGAEAAELLLAYEWPGNVRELRNAMEWVVFMYDDREVKPCHLGILNSHFSSDFSNGFARIIDPLNFTLPQGGFCLDDYTDRIIEKALDMHKGNKAEAARMLGITRRAFSYRLEKANPRLADHD
ncbi:sigma-54-dependent transcriptional regulator [Sporomusa malonica]|uniref:DNA-binding transcriptional response regulator, NtrC family, contains REC, AAA-type ATPase, and a Fis-type DNA-binding domains n=1 Tax=Sporomusa malonica TaxID=112901 RepID=A0A1W2BCR0_9FIRM|nr:sigma-54 dependent transcriptional regulator [Sporomusa malonica]SMC70560.1 DNA-binding transcriptional response regulator, NtrC family, contains REC, AAA-type ATPase, and a Fis-type DNA-binding domains [Sporomusa malonica]